MFEYNELIQAHFKTANDLDLQTNFDWLTKDYGKMEAKKRPCWSWRVPIYSRGNNWWEINTEMENHTHEFQVHIQKLKGQLETLHKSPNKTSQPTYMDNQLKEFEELIMDNTLFKG